MTTLTAGAASSARICFARLYQLIGLAGLGGIALLCLASVLAALAWSTQNQFVRREVSSVRAPSPTPSASGTFAELPPAPELPSQSEIPLLLTQMKQSAVGNGLDWRAAEYRITTASAAQPASLEVHCNLKGPYPKLRAMLVQLASDIPAFSLRGFVANRPNADGPEVDAKLVLAVLLQDGPAIPESSDTATKAVP